jgi:hypothetical protein
MRSFHWVLAVALLVAACGDETTSPTDVVLGETTLVMIVNPRINDLNSASVSPPGSPRQGVKISVEGGPSAITDAEGVAVLPRVSTGQLTLRFSGSSASLIVNVAEKDLREVAVSVTDASARVMADIRYPFSGQVVEVTPTMSIAEVNQALNGSDKIILLRGGTYTGDIQFNGSNVSLFGEGPSGGRVTLTGNVALNGSNSRIRGARVTGQLSINGSGNGLTFSQIIGKAVSDGSDGVFIGNRFCGELQLTGGNLTVLENAGAAPLARPTTGC